MSRTRTARRGARALLRTVLLALAVAFAVGFGVGTWLRCRMERPTGYLGAREAPPRLAGTALPLDVRNPGAAILEPRQHEEQVREAIQVADRRRVEALGPVQ